MKILVIGGMGIIGGAITEAAALKGYDVYVLSRRKLSEKWSKLGVKVIAGNWLNDSFAEKVVSEGYDVIVDTLVFDETRLMQSAKIVDGHCKHYIYISTDSVSPHPADNLSEDEMLRVCDELAQAHCLKVTLIGGEAFLNPSWKAVVKKLRALNIDVAIVTNGLCLNKKTQIDY